jgi:hypothetical protein
MDIEFSYSSEDSQKNANFACEKEISPSNFEFWGYRKILASTSFPQLDGDIVNVELLKRCYLVVVEIVQESRQVRNVEITAEDVENDKVMIGRLILLLNHVKEFLRLRNSEVIYAMIFLKRIRESRRLDEKFHCTSYVDMIFYLVCCMLLSHKVSQDVPYSNKYWAKVCNLNIETVNACERHCLDLLSFNTYISAEEYQMFPERSFNI